jgi:leader peptidase (prepilin peptidase) / N-methyltransferase
MMRILATVFAALAGLAFGSFLNVCLTRWPEGESVAKPRSHCRSCDRTLAWWENIPLVSWITLRGRCRTCGAWIGIRYPLVELAVGALWGIAVWRLLRMALESNVPAISPLLHWNLYNEIGWTFAILIFFWTLVAIAALDAENFWIPDWLTFPGTLLGLASFVIYEIVAAQTPDAPPPSLYRLAFRLAASRVVGIALAALLILLIRWTYKLLRKREGIGLGDAKLMAMLAAWLGLPGALLSFFIGVVLGAAVALIALALPSTRAKKTSADEDNEAAPSWSLHKLPLGTFLSIGGIVSALWGQTILAAYLRWAGF